MLLPRRRGRLARWLAPGMQTVLLRSLWVILVVWAEIGTFFWSLSGCRWPDAALGDSQTSSARPALHAMLLADAKVNPPSNSSRTFGRLRGDGYLRKAWYAASGLHPDAVFFLGDMLSAGDFVDDDNDFLEYVRYFHGMFPIDPKTEVYYIPGNTDVGLGVSSGFTRHVRDRYRTYFGPLNFEVRLANHTFVIIDAPGIVDEDYVRVGKGVSFEQWPPIRGGPVEFVKDTSEHIRERNMESPVILLTHIPLHRAETKKCGPWREQGSIRRGVGKGWQAILGKQTSQFLLDSLQPTVVFSGDDRDYCEITHPLPTTGQEIREITLKSFSPTRHIERPGFQLLSLIPDGPAGAQHASALCLLPSTRSPITHLYLPFLVINIIVLLVFYNKTPQRGLKEFVSPLPLSATDTSFKLKDGPSPPSDPFAGSSHSDSYAKSHSGAPPSPALSGETTYRNRMLNTVVPHLLLPEPESPSPYGARSPNGAGLSLVGARRPRLRVPLVDTSRIAGAEPLWAWSFTFRGQRRRFAVGVPVGALALGRRGGAWRVIARELARILWFPLCVWAYFLWLFS